MTAPGWIFHLLLAVGLACVSGAAEGARNFGALEFEPCTLSSPGLPLTVPAQCTGVSVPEDPARPELVDWEGSEASRVELDCAVE